MRRMGLAVTTVVGTILGQAALSHATPLFSVSGRVDGEGQLPSGVTVRLEVDLDRNGQFSQFERMTGTVDGSGNYRVTYDLDPTKLSLQEMAQFATFASETIATYNSRGFDGLLDGGPMPVVLTFEREGYSTVVRRLNTMFENPDLGAVLTPLKAVGCSAGGCQSASGNLLVSGFPGGTGIDRAYAEAYDPALDTSRFPGGFVEQQGSLLISSGFMEVDFRDKNGARVTNVSSPVAVRYEANANSWSTLRDLQPGDDRIQVPMWSFDSKNAQWVAEANGELSDATGTLIPESELGGIQTSSYAGKVFIGFKTQHFSSWNCDHPVSEHTCVKGRLVSEANGTALAGVNVTVSGVSYTGASGSVTTGTDGYFVADVMRSENPGEDVDGNGKTGETFQVRVSASGALGIFAGTPFNTSVENLVISSAGTPKCRPAACSCPDLGNVVAKFEAPRLCQITVHATYSGTSLTGQSPLPAGSAVGSARIHGRLSGTEVPPAAAQSVCAGQPCLAGNTDAQGNVTFLVPLLGDTPRIEIKSDFTAQSGTEYHYYSGSTSVAGCARGETALSGTIELQYTHASLSAMASFIATLGDGPKDAGLLGATGDLQEAAKNCLCRSVPSGRGQRGTAALVALAVALGLGRRRRT